MKKLCWNRKQRGKTGLLLNYEERLGMGTARLAVPVFMYDGHARIWNLLHTGVGFLRLSAEKACGNTKSRNIFPLCLQICYNLHAEKNFSVNGA